MDKIARYYLMHEIWETVTESQVFGWLELQKSKGYCTNCLSITDVANWLKKRDVRAKAIADQIGGKFYRVPIIDRGSFLIDIQVFVVLFAVWIKEVWFVDKIIFQSRMISVAYALSWIRLLPKVRVIFDSRGSAYDEMRYNLRGQKLGFKSKASLLSVMMHERMALRCADRIFVVSNQLKQYHLQNVNRLSDEMIIVIPGGADTRHFYFDESLRTNCREKFKLQDKIVVVYSGGLRMKWAIPDKIFELVKHLFPHVENLVLLLLTPDVDLAKNLRDRYAFSKEQVIILKAGYRDVNCFLNASDIALLLREDDPTNNNASPTKFSEYVLSGLPVIISASVKDFAEFARVNKIGFVVESLDKCLSAGNNALELLVQFILMHARLPDKERNFIAQKGAPYLSKQAFLAQIISAIETV